MTHLVGVPFGHDRLDHILLRLFKGVSCVRVHMVMCMRTHACMRMCAYVCAYAYVNARVHIYEAVCTMR